MTQRRFSYKALDSRGQTMDGVMEAATADEVGTWLADRQYLVLEIKDVPFSVLTAATQRIAPLQTKEMNYFLIQLSSLLNAGCPLLLSLQALHRQLPAGNMKSLLRDLKEKIEAGKSLSDALKAHPRIFSNLLVTMVEVGEVGGILDQVLEKYSEIFDGMYRIRGKIVKSMIYPIILLVLTIVVCWALLVYVFPVFVAQVANTGHVLPLPTRWVLLLSNALTGKTLFIIVGLIALLMAYLVFRQTPSGARLTSNIGLNLPLFGRLIAHMQLALFARILGTLLRCGVPILTSLAAVEKALGNELFRQALRDLRSGVARGESLTQGMSRNRDLFPDSLILMIDVGERGGSTGAMLEKAAEIYERDLETTIEAVVSLIQPLLVIVMALFIVFLALAMYLPLFDIIKVIR